MAAGTLRAAAVLLLIPGPLAEVLSQNTPVTTFVQPVPFLLTALTYGVPVLLIRELAVARGLNALGIVVLGLAYGLFNEGIIAKTLTAPGGEGVFGFAGYGKAGPFQTGLALFIVFWHALHSVLYPILIAHWLFPATARVRWLHSRWGRVVLWLLLAALAGLYSLYFLNPVRNDLDTFVAYAVATVVLVAVAVRSCKGGDAGHGSKVTYWPAVIGSAMIVFYFLQLLSPGRVSFAIYASISLAAIAAGMLAMYRARWRPIPQVLMFGLGDALSFALLAGFMAVISGKEPVLAIVTGVAFALLCLILMRAVRRSPEGRRGALTHRV